MGTLETQFHNNGLENGAKENELNDDFEIRNEAGLSDDELAAEEVGEQLDGLEVDVDDPVDLGFWAEQFEISPDELRKAVLVVGKSIDAITHYLQK